MIFRAANAVNLVCNQINMVRRIIYLKGEVLINLKLEAESHETNTAEETCLSCEDAIVEVTRPTSILVSYVDEHADLHEKFIEGEDARLI